MKIIFFGEFGESSSGGERVSRRGNINFIFRYGNNLHENFRAKSSQNGTKNSYLFASNTRYSRPNFFPLYLSWWSNIRLRNKQFFPALF